MSSFDSVSRCFCICHVHQVRSTPQRKIIVYGMYCSLVVKNDTFFFFFSCHFVCLIPYGASQRSGSIGNYLYKYSYSNKCPNWWAWTWQHLCVHWICSSVVHFEAILMFLDSNVWDTISTFLRHASYSFLSFSSWRWADLHVSCM